MATDDIIRAQAVIREFGYDIQDYCHKSAEALLGLGMLEEAERTISASRELLDLLREISGKDFLLTGRG
jgi:hypothetical protein